MVYHNKIILQLHFILRLQLFDLTYLACDIWFSFWCIWCILLTHIFMCVLFGAIVLIWFCITALIHDILFPPDINIHVLFGFLILCGSLCDRVGIRWIAFQCISIHFWWGTILLSGFSDIDKTKANLTCIFSYHFMQSYLKYF